jgi:hypothetical protein
MSEKPILDPTDLAILEAVEDGRLELDEDDIVQFLSGGALEVLHAEQVHGDRVLDEHPELAGAARALQHARAAYAAQKLGLRLRGDGKPLPRWLADELGRVLRRVIVRPP